MLNARNQKSLKLKVMIRINSVKLAYLGSLVVYVNRFNLLNQAESCFHPSLKSHEARVRRTEH